MATSSLTERLAAEIRAEMARQRKPASALAAETDIPFSTLSRRLSGRNVLTLDELARIATSLGVSIGDLLDRSEPLSSHGGAL